MSKFDKEFGTRYSTFKSQRSAKNSTKMGNNFYLRTIEGFSDRNFRRTIGANSESYLFKEKEQKLTRNLSQKGKREFSKKKGSLPKFWKTDSFRKTLSSVANKAKKSCKRIYYTKEQRRKSRLMD